MSSTPQKPDRLSTLIPELLVKIIAEVPLHLFLDIKHTSRFFRDFLLRNASTICNYAIRSRHSGQAMLLSSTCVSGWLVPTHPEIATEERILERILITYEKEGRVKCLGLLGERKVGQGLQIKLTSPGPQYLHFLQSEIVRKSDNRRADGYPSVHFPIAKFMSGEVDFSALLLDYNSRPVDEEGKDVKGERARFLRELIWYYGVEALVLEGK